MLDSTLHLAPNAPWLILALVTLAAIGLSVWAYRFAIPPLPAIAKGVLPVLRALALAVLVWLLAQPVVERANGGGASVLVLLDRSRSMDLAVAPGGPARAAAADQAVDELIRALRGRAAVHTMRFGDRLAADSARSVGREATALGDAIQALAQSPESENATSVVVVSDGAVNAGADPIAAGKALGLPVHAVVVGHGGGIDRVITGVEASSEARVGSPTPVRVRVSTTEERGRSFTVRLTDRNRELARQTVVAPGGGAEVTAEFRVTPLEPGLGVWTARADTLAGEVSTVNNARSVAVDVAPGRIGVLLVSGGLNWDLTFLRRALAGDSSLKLDGFVRGRSGWDGFADKPVAAPTAASLDGISVLVLDAIAPQEISPAFDPAIADFVRRGGAVLVFGGQAPGLARIASSRLGRDLGLTFGPTVGFRAGAAPQPAPEARELLQWDDDPARGEQAWREAAPLSDVQPLSSGPGDRVLIHGDPQGPPLLLARMSGRGRALLVNGTGLWRWSLSGHDDLTQDRARRLWRGLVHWLAEPVQAEPLRVKPERWLTSRGEPVRLFATLQDDAFHPIANADVQGEVVDAAGGQRRLTFEARAAGSYVAEVDDLPPGRFRVNARAERGGRSLGRASSDFAVDRWSLEEARTQPDSAGLAALASATQGSVTGAASVGRWARSLPARTLARGRMQSIRLWESPWLFGLIVGALSIEWAWRRKRGLP